METCKLELIDVIDNEVDEAFGTCDFCEYTEVVSEPYYKFKVTESNNPKIVGEEFTIRGFVFQGYDGFANHVLPWNEIIAFDEWLRKRTFHLSNADDLGRAIIEGMEYDGYGVYVAYTDYDFLQDLLNEWKKSKEE